MKTNRLMTAVALSAMFAACTQDAELNETLAKNDLSNIPMVEAKFTVDTGVDSRMATKFGWEVGDKVGLAWMGGTITDLTGDEIETVEWTGEAFQNHPLYCRDAKGSFGVETMLYVGNYFAYMPYDATHMGVGRINFDASNQTLSTDANDLAKSAIYIAPATTSLEQPNDEGKIADDNDKAGVGNNIPLNIARVSNAATINLTFANTDGLTDLKVYGVALDLHKEIVKEVKDITTGDVTTTVTAGVKVLPESFTYGFETQTAALAEDAEEWTGYGVTEFFGDNNPANATVGVIKAGNENGIAVVSNELKVYMLTLPATESNFSTEEDTQNITDGDGDVVETVVTTTSYELDVTVETNYGNVTVRSGATYNEGENDYITYTEGDKDPTTNFAESSLFTDFGAAGTMDVYVDMSRTAVEGNNVSSQEELMQKLNSLVVAGYDKPVTYNIALDQAENRKKTFTFTDFTLPEGLKAKITLTAEAVDGVDNVEYFVFNGNTKINKQLVLDAPAQVNGTMTVDLITRNSTTLETLEGENLTINSGARLINNGKITNCITTVKYDSTNKVAAGLYVSNNAKASSGEITNNGEVQWIAGEINASSGVIFANVVDFSTMNAAGKAGVNTARFTQASEFGNSGRDVTISGNITNIEISAPITMNITKDDITGEAVTISFPGLSNTTYPLPTNPAEKAAVVIEKNGGLTITSDYARTLTDHDDDPATDKVWLGNVINWGMKTVMTSAESTKLNFGKIWFKNLSTIEHAGDVITTNAYLEECSTVATGDGEHTSSN